jgi:hypothetical protein
MCFNTSQGGFSYGAGGGLKPITGGFYAVETYRDVVLLKKDIFIFAIISWAVLFQKCMRRKLYEIFQRKSELILFFILQGQKGVEMAAKVVRQ